MESITETITVMVVLILKYTQIWAVDSSHFKQCIQWNWETTDNVLNSVSNETEKLLIMF